MAEYLMLTDVLHYEISCPHCQFCDILVGSYDSYLPPLPPIDVHSIMVSVSVGMSG